MLHSKGNHKKKKQNTKRQHIEGEKLVSNDGTEGLNLKNIQTTYTTQQPKKPTTQLKNGKKKLE